MKKKFCFIFLLLMMFMIPTQVFAIKLVSAYFDAPLSAKAGDSINVRFKMSFADMDINGPQGIFTVVSKLEYDSSTLTATNVKSNIPFTTMTTLPNNGGLEITSVVDEDDSPSTKCIDKTFFCGTEYTVDITFLINKDAKGSTKIKMSEIYLGLVNVEVGKEYDESDLKARTVEAGQTVSIRFIEETSTLPSPSTNTNISTNNTTVIKSNNRFLKKLEIENYTISFDKYKYNYDIEVDEGVNSLNVKAEVQDSKAKYTITGNDDLAKNDNKVVITVTAENGETKEYAIYVKKKGESTSTKTDSKEFKKATINVDKKYIKIGYIVGAVILVIIIISFVVKKINDRKLDKLVNKM